MRLLNFFHKAGLAVVFAALATHVSAREAVQSQEAAPQILASIKPLQLISQAITHGVSETEVLLPAGASPHDYSLKFSDQRKLQAADIVLWVGPDMETFLGKVLKNANNKTAIEMMAIEGLTQRKERGHDNHDHGDHHDDHGHHDNDNDHHHHGEFDPHVWLSTHNALIMANAINDKLQQLDKNTANREKYTANLRQFAAQLKAADTRNNDKLKDIKQKPFFVFHDAYGHLQDNYGLNVAGYFTLNPQQQPGARHLEKIRNQLKEAGRTCVFREPQFQPAYINRLTDGLPVKVGVLDPLGEGIPNTDSGYIKFINSMVDNISDCLGRNPS